jgi:predicted AlkP superfamily pyrophosphatase or phosphodiesterase
MPLPPLRTKLFLALLLAAGVLAVQAFPETVDQSPPEPPKLVVLVVFDQMRGDYPQHWEALYDQDGFGRLLHEGAWFQNCHYPYAYTLTAPGHTSLATGCPPRKHGIIANEWYDRNLRQVVGAVATSRYREVAFLGQPSRSGSASPERRQEPSVGDSLKTAKPRAKVVSLSIKDRSAILLAALRATACYWFSTQLGLFVTSTFYRDTPHDWVEEFNRQRPADRYFGKDWTKLRPDLDYVAYSGPDDVACEGTGYMQGRTFPHPTTGGIRKPGPDYYYAMLNSPFGNELLLDLAKRAIDAERLGQRDTCDLLCLSFSSNDLIGHCWGPDSQEVFDMTLRSDLIIKELLAHLDAKVGMDRYVLVVSADHGVGPIPEVAVQQGKTAGRVAPNLFTGEALAFLQKSFGKGKKALPWIDAFKAGYIYLNQAVLKEMKLPAAQVEQTLADWLTRQPGICAAYPRSRLLGGPFAGDPIGESVRLSFHPDCSGDVAVVEQPYHMISGPITSPQYNSYRATHGTPHPYDTHVPLLVYGCGIRPGRHTERITPLSAAAIIARALGVPPPHGAEYPVPEGLFQ